MSDQQPSPEQLRALVRERFDEFKGQRTATAVGRPSTILGVDPDSRASALCVADYCARDGVYLVREVIGGGTPKDAAPWQSTHGIAELLRGLVAERDPSELVVAVETQGLKSEFAHDCEPLFRWRYTCAALCELRGVRCIEVDPTMWMRLYVPQAFKRGAGKGAAKVGYMARARELVGRKVATNEDRCAAVGIASWLAAQFGCELRVRP